MLVQIAYVVFLKAIWFRFCEAEELELQVLETRKMVLEKEDLDILYSMSNLASIYRGQGHFMIAEKLEDQVLGMNLRTRGREHSDTLTALSNLASTSEVKGDGSRPKSWC